MLDSLLFSPVHRLSPFSHLGSIHTEIPTDIYIFLSTLLYPSVSSSEDRRLYIYIYVPVHIMYVYISISSFRYLYILSLSHLSYYSFFLPSVLSSSSIFFTSMSSITCEEAQETIDLPMDQSTASSWWMIA